MRCGSLVRMLFVFGLVVALVGGVSAGAQPVKLTDGRSYSSSPAWSRDGKKIAYSSYVKGNVDVWVADVKFDSKGEILPLENSRQLTAEPAIDDDPAWSPDGNQIAFSSNRNGKWQVFVMKADGTDARLLCTEPAVGERPAWSPDGNSIAFVSDRNIVVADAESKTTPRFVTDTGYNDYPSWSSDGATIVFGAGTDLKVMKADGKDAKPLTQVRWNGEPAWSPVGDRLAYVSSQENRYDLWVMRLDGSSPFRLTDDLFREGRPAWSPDGKWIAYRSNCGGNYDLWAVRVPEKAPVAPEEAKPASAGEAEKKASGEAKSGGPTAVPERPAGTAEPVAPPPE